MHPQKAQCKNTQQEKAWSCCSRTTDQGRRNAPQLQSYKPDTQRPPQPNNPNIIYHKTPSLIICAQCAQIQQAPPKTGLAIPSSKNQSVRGYPLSLLLAFCSSNPVLAISNQWGWAPSTPSQPCCGKTWQSIRLLFATIVQSRISGNLLTSLFILYLNNLLLRRALCVDLSSKFA